MQIVPTSLTVADYCQGMERGEIVVNHDYQRSDKVWPLVARSFLIETILLGYPIPKLFLHQVTDIKTRRTMKAIVDGQQRSTAIRDFYNGNLKLSPSLDLEDAAGHTYGELPENLQNEFLNYGLSLDLFVGATEDDVREVFRRMNLFTVPLNPEEQRHAVYQGKFKWFVHKIARGFADPFQRIGLFSSKQLVRMADTKLLTEIVHAILNGFTTTDRRRLDALYKSRDGAFPEEEAIRGKLTSALDEIIAWEPLRGTSLMKPYQIYSLALAVMHVHSPVESLKGDFESPGVAELDVPLAMSNLTALSAALDDPDNPGAFESFVKASSEKTNVAAERRQRFVWFCKALTSTTM